MAWGSLYLVIHMFLWILSLWIYFLLIPPSAGSKILTVAQNSLCSYLSAPSLEMGLFNQHFFYYYHYHYYYLDFNILRVFDQNKAKPSIKTVKINLCYPLAVVHSYHRVTDKLNCQNTILCLTQPMHLSLSVVQNF